MAHPRAAMSLRQLLVVALLFGVTAGFLPSAASAQVVQRNVLITVARLNPDCYPDTVLGVLEIPSMTSLPTRIRWGQPPAVHDRDSGRQKSHGNGDAARDSCSDGIDAKRKLRETAIIYPDWKDFTASVAFQQLNDDAMPDILFYLRGKVEVDGELRDTLRPLVLYGQYGLDTMMLLNLTDVPAFQSEPFFASELYFGRDFTNDKQRDMRDSVSWELLRTKVNVRSRDTTKTDGQIVDGRQQYGGDPPAFAVHPNPSQEVASVEAEQLPAGTWTVEVVGVNGAVYHRQEVVMDEPGNVLRTLDVRRLANGYYVLRVRNTQGIVGTYPIVVKR